MFNPIDISASTTGQLVDKYGEMLARAAEIKKHADAIKAEIIANGAEAVEGKRYRCTVSLSERQSLDSKAVKAFLTPAQITACTKVSDVTTVRCTAKTGKGV